MSVEKYIITITAPPQSQKSLIDEFVSSMKLKNFPNVSVEKVTEKSYKANEHPTRIIFGYEPSREVQLFCMITDISESEESLTKILRDQKISFTDSYDVYEKTKVQLNSDWDGYKISTIYKTETVHSKQGRKPGYEAIWSQLRSSLFPNKIKSQILAFSVETDYKIFRSKIKKIKGVKVLLESAYSEYLKNVKEDKNSEESESQDAEMLLKTLGTECDPQNDEEEEEGDKEEIENQSNKSEEEELMIPNTTSTLPVKRKAVYVDEIQNKKPNYNCSENIIDIDDATQAPEEFIGSKLTLEEEEEFLLAQSPNDSTPNAFQEIDDDTKDADPISIRSCLMQNQIVSPTQDKTAVSCSDEKDPVDDNKSKALIIFADRNSVIIPLIYIKFKVIEDKDKQKDIYKNYINSLKSHQKAKILNGELVNVVDHNIKYVFLE